jgi:hypothetical protein
LGVDTHGNSFLFDVQIGRHNSYNTGEDMKWPEKKKEFFLSNFI